METQQMTEQEVRRIAREESEIVFEKATKKLCADIKKVNEGMEANREILARLERLLLGEIGVDETDTLKARANFAYVYAKRNTESGIIEDAKPALAWFKDMNSLEPGCKETKLESLGKLITFYSNVKWIMGIIGFTTVINAIPIIEGIIRWIEGLV